MAKHSGGPLFNLNGDVVGVNSAIYSPTGASVGIAFVIPHYTAERIVTSLRENGRVRRGYLGAGLRTAEYSIDGEPGFFKGGATINDVLPGSPADIYGLQVDDIILDINGQVVKNSVEATRAIGRIKPGKVATFIYERGEKTYALEVQIGERPEKYEIRKASAEVQGLPRILVVEDDSVAAEYVRKGLMEAGHVVDLAPDGDMGLEMARAADYDALILDRMLPKRDGLEILADLREDGDAVPVLILSALGEVDQKVEGLRAGGDDYLAKPYSFTELLARVEAIGRRSDPTAAVTKLKVGGLEMDLLARTVRRDGQKILLQPREFRLLECLMRNAGRVVTRTMLLEKVWDYHFDPQTNVIDVHISRLRGKIDKEFDEPLLHTVRGAGYRLQI